MTTTHCKDISFQVHRLIERHIHVKWLRLENAFTCTCFGDNH